MRRVNAKSHQVTFLAGLFSIALVCALILATGYLTPVTAEAQQAAGVTVFEGARLIVGDGSQPVEDSAFIVQNNRFTSVGRRGQIKVPAGEAYSRVENPKGELGFYVVSDGSATAYRYHVRSPSFINLTALEPMCI